MIMGVSGYSKSVRSEIWKWEQIAPPQAQLFCWLGRLRRGKGRFGGLDDWWIHRLHGNKTGHGVEIWLLMVYNIVLMYLIMCKIIKTNQKWYQETFELESIVRIATAYYIFIEVSFKTTSTCHLLEKPQPQFEVEKQEREALKLLSSPKWKARQAVLESTQGL